MAHAYGVYADDVLCQEDELDRAWDDVPECGQMWCMHSCFKFIVNNDGALTMKSDHYEYIWDAETQTWVDLDD